jgi:excisionase family DNA binding protein
MERLLLRPVEAAEMLGVSRSKIYELLAEGELPVVMLGPSMRVPLHELRRWISNRMRGSGVTAPAPERANG